MTNCENVLKLLKEDVTQLMDAHIKDIQSGRAANTHNWAVARAGAYETVLKRIAELEAI